MENKKLSFATVVATPTKTSWSQVYNAGGLFAVLSITSELEITDEENSLGVVGKDILETLEKEYFTLETKNLASIKQAVVITCEKLKEREKMVFSLVVASITDATLYVFSLGDGKAILKRDTRLGTILDSGETKEVTSASGFLQDGDTIIIATKQFTKLIPKDMLSLALDHNSPSEIAERFSPKIHEQEEGGASAIILKHQEEGKTEEAKLEVEDEILQAEEPKQNRLRVLLKALKTFPFNLPDGLTHRRKVFLTITVLLTVVLFVSIFLAIKKREDDKTQRLFQEIYSQAQKKYDEGEGLADLNNNLARDDFLEAQKILTGGQVNFSKNSTEEKQIAELLKKVEDALEKTSGVNKVSAQPADGQSVYLDLEHKNSALSFSRDEKFVYGIDSTSVFSIDKKTQAKKTLIKNSSFWKDVGGMAVYFGNIYVLDKTSGQILKFTQAEEGFGKTNYLPAPQDFSKASSIAIDGSIWVLFQDGSVKKFTKGKQDELNVAELDSPFAKPSKIYTNIDFDNVYILDNGNKRIVVLNKNGAYQSQYTNDLLKDSKDFEVVEKDLKIFILSQNKVWQIDLK